MYDNENKLDGLTVDYIDISDDTLLITTKCGRKFEFYHCQDCCENVWIYDSVGDLKTLEGKKLVSVTMEVDDIPEDVDYEKCDYGTETWTNIIFKTTDETVISRWIGESNGYYSESVDFKEL